MDTLVSGGCMNPIDKAEAGARQSHPVLYRLLQMAIIPVAFLVLGVPMLLLHAGHKRSTAPASTIAKLLITGFVVGIVGSAAAAMLTLEERAQRSVPGRLRRAYRAFELGRYHAAIRRLDRPNVLHLPGGQGELAYRTLWRSYKRLGNLHQAAEWSAVYLVRFPLGSSCDEAGRIVSSVLEAGDFLLASEFVIPLDDAEFDALQRVLACRRTRSLSAHPESEIASESDTNENAQAITPCLMDLDQDSVPSNAPPPTGTTGVILGILTVVGLSWMIFKHCM